MTYIRHLEETQKNKPSEWLRNKQTIELVEEVEKAGIPAIYKKQQLGTFAVKELVYSYAMWISAKFHLTVIRAYDALINQPYNQDQSTNSISIGLNFPEGMRQITLRFESEGFSHGRWFTALSDGRIMIEKLNDNAMPLTFEQWIEYAIKERGYVVLPKHQVLAKLVA